MREDVSIEEELAWTRAALERPVDSGRWRIWRYRAPEIVLGCSQRRLQERLLAHAEPGLPLLRRASGGGAVFAGPWLLGITVILPDAHPLLAGRSLVDSYRWLGELHARVLARAGIDARALDPAHARQRTMPLAVSWACFGSVSPWEVVDGRGRKLTGLSQRRVRGAVAYSAGTLLSRPPWRDLCAIVGAPQDCATLDAWTSACDEIAPELDAAEWARRFAGALQSTLNRQNV